MPSEQPKKIAKKSNAGRANALRDKVLGIEEERIESKTWVERKSF